VKSAPTRAVAAALLVTGAACGATTSTQAQAPDYGRPGDPAHADRVITIEARDSLRFIPGTVTFHAGDTVTFRIHNAGHLPHEFVLGDQKVQNEHDKEMRGAQMSMTDQPNGVELAPETTEDLTWTFPVRGTVIYGCHEPGHYAAGMRGTVHVR
jgi:uncharacterized cupredoxin-like copper-binding protein